MKKLIYLCYCFLLLSCNIYTKKNVEVEKIGIDYIKIYLTDSPKGYTTSGASTHFDELLINKEKYTIIDSNDVSQFEEVLSGSEISKHRQTKFGGGIIFCELKYKNQEKADRVIISGVTDSIDLSRRVVIVNLNKMRNYAVNNEKHKILLNELKNKICK